MYGWMDRWREGGELEEEGTAEQVDKDRQIMLKLQLKPLR